MNWLRRFMIGRYGADKLSHVLLGLSIVLTLIGRLTGSSLFMTISYMTLLVGIYRILSKDLQRRRMENYKFLMFITPIYAKIKKVQTRMKNLKTHQYYKCSKCKTTLRVPRGKGKILITCPKCTEKFTKNT